MNKCFSRKRTIWLLTGVISTFFAVTLFLLCAFLWRANSKVAEAFYDEYVIIARGNAGLYIIDGDRPEDCRPLYWHMGSSGIASNRIASPTFTQRNTLIGIAFLDGENMETLAEVDLVSGKVAVADTSFAWCKSVVYSSTNVTITADRVLVLDYPGKAMVVASDGMLYRPMKKRDVRSVDLADVGITVREKLRWSIPTGIDFVISKGLSTGRGYRGDSGYLTLFAVVRRTREAGSGRGSASEAAGCNLALSAITTISACGPSEYPFRQVALLRRLVKIMHEARSGSHWHGFGSPGKPASTPPVLWVEDRLR